MHTWITIVSGIESQIRVSPPESSSTRQEILMLPSLQQLKPIQAAVSGDLSEGYETMTTSGSETLSEVSVEY